MELWTDASKFSPYCGTLMATFSRDSTGSGIITAVGVGVAVATGVGRAVALGVAVGCGAAVGAMVAAGADVAAGAAVGAAVGGGRAVGRGWLGRIVAAAAEYKEGQRKEGRHGCQGCELGACYVLQHIIHPLCG